MKRLYKVSYYVEMDWDENEDPSESQIVDACERETSFNADFAYVEEIY